VDLIKTTPPELAVPSFSIELDFEANALADLSHNPGIKPEVMLDLARRVITETRGLSYKRQIGELEYLARKHLRLSTAPTEAIVRAVSATRNGAANVLSMADYEPAERPVQSEQFHPDDLPPAA
jgi:hypothetical protein